MVFGPIFRCSGFGKEISKKLLKVQVPLDRFVMDRING